jgi:hypothetical protein
MIRLLKNHVLDISDGASQFLNKSIQFTHWQSTGMLKAGAARHAA